MSYTLSTRGARWVATCDDCTEEVYSGPSKVGVTAKADKHVCGGGLVGRLKATDDDADVYGDLYRGLRQVKVGGKGRPGLWSARCAECGESASGVSKDTARTRVVLHWEMMHGNMRERVSEKIFKILIGDVPPPPEHPPF